jgi:cellulose synthase (UDP-forming)
MVAGLQPETFSSFVQQRGRWATGMIQMLLLKGPLLRRGLSVPQRLCYLNSMAFWFFPLVRLAYIVAPLAYLFFGIEIFVATWQSAVAFVAAYLAVSFLTQNALYARHRWPLISEIYEIAQAPYLARAIFQTLLRPRSASFKVTSKTETLDEPFLSPIFAPLLAVFALTVLGVAALAARWVMFPGDHPVLVVVGSWAVLNFLLVGLALRAVCERRQRRAAPRVPLDTPAVLSLDPLSEAAAASGAIIDGSMTGVRLSLDQGAAWGGAGGPATGDRVWLTPRFPDAPRLERPVECILRSVTVDPGRVSVGLAFADNLPIAAHETLAFLVFGQSSNWLEMRRAANEPRGLVAGIAYVLSLSLLRLPDTLRFVATMPTTPQGAKAAAGLDQRQSLLSFEADLDALKADAQSDRRQVDSERNQQPVDGAPSVLSPASTA